MTQFTASEVRELAATIWPDLSGREEVAETLNAFADLLAAQEKAVPVMVVNHVSSAEHDLPIGMKLYAHPGPYDAERLAEALRVFDGSFLKELADLVSFPEDDRGCINRSFVMERVVGLRRCWDKLSATRTHSAQAQPPAASATKRERKGHTEWRQGSEKDGGGTTNYVEPVWVWDEPEQTAASVPDSNARDAARYQWLRVHYDVSASRHGVNDLLAIRLPQQAFPHTGTIMDSFVDNAMLAAQENPNG